RERDDLAVMESLPVDSVAAARVTEAVADVTHGEDTEPHVIHAVDEQHAGFRDKRLEGLHCLEPRTERGFRIFHPLDAVLRVRHADVHDAAPDIADLLVALARRVPHHVTLRPEPHDIYGACESGIVTSGLAEGQHSLADHLPGDALVVAHCESRSIRKLFGRCPRAPGTVVHEPGAVITRHDPGKEGSAIADVS